MYLYTNASGWYLCWTDGQDEWVHIHVNTKHRSKVRSGAFRCGSSLISSALVLVLIIQYRKSGDNIVSTNDSTIYSTEYWRLFISTDLLLIQLFHIEAH